MALRVLGVASLFHLAMVNVESYIAIKDSLRYETLVTETRLIYVSAVLWIVTILLQLTVPADSVDNDDNNYVIIDTGIMFLCIVTIFFCQVVLYFETRRHEKEIASQQVSVEAREKFMKEKKAFKLTTTILFFLMLNSYLPLIASRLLVSTFVITSVNSAYFAFFTGVFTACFVQFPFKSNYTLCANSTVSSCVEGNCAKKINHTGCERNQWKLSL